MTVEVEEVRTCEDCDREKPLSSFLRNGKEEPICWKCRTSSIILGKPSDLATRTKKQPRRRVKADSYAKGIPTDRRGMPWLDSSLNEIGQREHDEKRHLIDKFEREKRTGLFDEVKAKWQTQESSIPMT